MNSLKSTILLICLLTLVHSQRCAANYGSQRGDPACCGQVGTVHGGRYVCPKEFPKCVGYIRNRRWGSCTDLVFSEAAAPGECMKKQIKDVGMVLGNNPHTVQVRLTFPDSAPTVRQWIVNLGQKNTGANHWIWRSDLSGQIGKWGGKEKQVKNVDISSCTYLTTTFSGSILKLYCDGTFLAQRNTDFDIRTPELRIGTIGFDHDFAGCISDVSIFAYEKTPEEVAQQGEAAFLGTCRWQTHQDSSLSDYMGWTCRDNEVVTGFGLTANDKHITKVQCCSIGGHSSVKPNTCSFIEATGIEAGKAFCGDNQDHKVFSGAYDKRARPGAPDAYTEVLAGKCCEVDCDAGWCAAKSWGVDKDDCQVITAQGNDAQELVCPTGTLMTEIHDALNGLAHGVQKVGAVKCCALDIVNEPTVAPTSAPSPSPTTAPTVSPTKAPTTAPSPSPTTAPSVSPTKAPTTVKHCLFENRDTAVGDVAYLEGLARCLSTCDVPDARRALEGRLLNEGEFY